MKRFTDLSVKLSALLLAVAMLFSLASCGGGGASDTDAPVESDTPEASVTTEAPETTEETTAPETEPETTEAPEGPKTYVELSEYKLIRSDLSSAEVKTLLTDMRKEISYDTGVNLTIGTDYDDPIEKEILIGDTKREESVRAMAELKTAYDYIIRQDGSKLVIVAGSDETLETAVSIFVDGYIDRDNKGFMFPEGDGIVYKYELAVDSLTIDGVDISKFTVVDNTLDGKYGESFAKKLALGFAGTELKVYNKEVKNSIVLDGGLLTYTDYEICVENGSLYIRGGYNSIDAAIEKFFELLSVGGDVELTSADNFSGSVGGVKIPYKNKTELMTVIESVYESDYFLMGEHLAGSMSPNTTIENYYKAVGEHPSIIDFDMLRLKDNSKAQWSKTLCELVEFAAKGGVITTMHHWLSPVAPENGFRGTLGGIEEWRELLTDGTELNLTWREELDRAGEFMKALNDAGVAFMYRPMHEVNGNWFWFCVGQGDGNVIPAEDTIDMWKYVYNYYTEGFGITDILWEYGPNVSQATKPVSNGAQPVDYYYPGEDYCDIVGYDWYTSGGYEIKTSNIDCHEVLADLRHPVAIMEFGPNGALRTGDAATQPDVFSCYGYVEIFEQMRDEGKKLAFVEVYGGIYGSPTVLGHGEALANYEYILHLEDMPALIASILG